MFIFGNAIVLVVHPLVLANEMDVIQKEGITHINIAFLCGLLLTTLAINLFFWAFHGPARIIERSNAFKTARGCYRKHLLRGVTVLHISSPKSAHPHKLTPFACVEGTRVTYPGSQPNLL